MKRYMPKDGIDEYQVRRAIAFTNYLFRIYKPLYVDLYKPLGIRSIKYKKETADTINKSYKKLLSNL